MTDIKKNCSKCHKRHFKKKLKCECGSAFFECDAIVVSRYYFENATGADIRRLMLADGYTVSNKAVLDAMVHLGYKNIRAQHEEKQENIKAYLRTLKKRPKIQSIIDLGMHARTARMLINEVFEAKIFKKSPISIYLGEEEILKDYLNKYNQFREKPKAQQFPLPPEMAGVINTLKRYKMI